LLAIENEPGLRVRDMADRLGLSERGVALILRDLREAGYVTSRREGRRVFYRVVPDKPLRSASLRHQTVGQLLGLLAAAEKSHRA
jgi:DNA-binding transcriptional ArsR family regulator